jgi:hypothetical protein
MVDEVVHVDPEGNAVSPVLCLASHPVKADMKCEYSLGHDGSHFHARVFDLPGQRGGPRVREYRW